MYGIDSSEFWILDSGLSASEILEYLDWIVSDRLINRQLVRQDDLLQSAAERLQHQLQGRKEKQGCTRVAARRLNL